MPKILHLITWFVPGGIEKWLLNMLRAVPRGDYVMDVCCKGSSFGELEHLARETGAALHHVKLGPAQAGYVAGLRRVLREGNYDLVHNHLEAYSGLGVLAAQTRGVPVITSFHNTRFAPQQRWGRNPVLGKLRETYAQVSVDYALRHSQLVTGCSQAVLESLNHDTSALNDKTRVLYYGVELPESPSAAERGRFRAELGWAEDTPIVLHVGRFVEQKNHAGLLKIFAQVLKVVPQAKLVLVGDGLLFSTVQQLIEREGLTQSVKLLGVRDDVPRLMTYADVFLLPSLFEGFGLVAIEASAAFLPIVGSNVPGLTEAVKAGETAFLHDVQDIDGMAQSVIKLLSDRALATQTGAAGRAWVEQHFSLQASARRLTEVYNACIGIR